VWEGIEVELQLTINIVLVFSEPKAIAFFFGSPVSFSPGSAPKRY